MAKVSSLKLSDVWQQIHSSVLSVHEPERPTRRDQVTIV